MLLIIPTLLKTILLVVCFATISTTNWIQPSDPLLFRADYTLSVGFYNGSIYLLGGYNQPNQLTEYVIADNLFIDHGLEALNTNSNSYGIYGYAQYWTQINHILYVGESYGWNNDDKVSIFNMKTKTFTSSVIEGIPTDGDISCCMTSNSTHIFFVGGKSSAAAASYLSLVQIYDLSSNEWITSAPSMNSARADFACIIHPINAKLYAIGGIVPSGYLSSIEVIQTSDIAHKTWTYINGTLSQGLAWSLCTIYKHNIYVIGGADDLSAINTVHIINVLTDEVTVLSNLMPIGLCSVAPIVVNHKLYVFGGWNNDNTGGTNTWMTYDLYIPTASPTEEPTKSTSFPTALSTESTAHTTTTLTTTADTKTTLEASQHSITFMPTTANIMTITTKAVTSKTTNMDFTTTNSITSVEDYISTTKDADHATTDLLSTTQQNKVSLLYLVIIVMITMVVIIIVLVVIIVKYGCLQKQDKLKQIVDFVEKADNNANNNNNAPKNARKPVQVPQNVNNVKKRKGEMLSEARKNRLVSVNEEDGFDEEQNHASLEGIEITEEGPRAGNVVNEDMYGAQTGTIGVVNDLDDAQKYKTNPNIASDEFIIDDEESNEFQTPNYNTLAQ